MNVNDAHLMTDDALVSVPLIRRKVLHIEQVQKRYQLSLSHVQIMMLLSQQGSITVSAISENLGISKPNVTPLIDRLCARALVERTRSQADRRMVHVSLTQEGHDLLARIREDIASWILTGLSDLPDESARALCDALHGATAILSGMPDTRVDA